MQRSLFVVIFCAMIFASACSSPTPIIIVVTATPAPVQPTLTPLPVLPSATPLPPPTAILPTLAPIIPATPTNIPPPPQPTTTPVLVPLSVFDQGGGNMAVFLFGGQVGKVLVFRTIACAPNCNNRPDGRDVNTVLFTFFKKLPQGTLRWVFEHTESNAPYCSFGGSANCDLLDISNVNARWPNTQNIIENGDHVLKVDVDGRNGASWHGSVNFRIQR